MEGQSFFRKVSGIDAHLPAQARETQKTQVTGIQKKGESTSLPTQIQVQKGNKTNNVPINVDSLDK